ncbi:MAG: UDP-N-acetylmuramoyl-tripeptide--D-alanyl-D-alanine ligase [Actinomycetota bacterium]|jgi:UDP-N-acetylmuramoyl-tripeptide--D-alanyl-D-alanine ligase|nr:UDP-N-acetylmuramoyl-tripeptide--D-alanyl-D-alanine ligase [Actinomycetota bacterium]
MELQASEVARATGGTLVGPDVVVRGVAIDSRLIEGGELFVPIVGDRDGHDFVDRALAAGAAAYLTSRTPAEGTTAIVVGDTGAALTALGRAARDYLPDRVVGITGSVGKTSTKDLLASVFSRRLVTAASLRSFNNELGVPMTLVNAPAGTEVVVVEMGARGRGHIASLCAVARPTVGVVTTVGMAHTELFGTVEEVAAAKGELVESLPADGTAVLNAGVPLVAAMAERTAATVLTFGMGCGEVRGDVLGVDGALRPCLDLQTPWGSTAFWLPVRGEHQAANAVAAAAAALACGVTLTQVVQGLRHATLSAWRMQLDLAPSGALVLNDAYNANPVSTEAALRSLAQLPVERRTAILGIMAELGEGGPAEHRRLGGLAVELGLRVIAVAAPDYGGEQAADPDDALRLLGPVGPGDGVLVKGSRAAGLERLAGRLAST